MRDDLKVLHSRNPVRPNDHRVGDPVGAWFVKGNGASQQNSSVLAGANLARGFGEFVDEDVCLAQVKT
jgi:hypothetical protein